MCSPICAGLSPSRRSRSTGWVRRGGRAGGQWTRQPPDDLLVARVRSKTAGNPFFIEELVRHLQDAGGGALAADESSELPASIKQVVCRRIARLDSRAVALLTAGGSSASTLTSSLLREVDGLPLDPALRALEQAVSGGLIVEVCVGRFAFAHALVRDALAGSFTRPERGLHSLAAAALEPRARRDPSVMLTRGPPCAEGAPLADDPLAPPSSPSKPPRVPASCTPTKTALACSIGRCRAA